MILVDTSVWIDHLRVNSPTLAAILHDESVMCHPFVIGEIALGNLTNRKAILQNLDRLPKASMAKDIEVLAMIEALDVIGKGIGYVDAHLIASTRLSGCRLWTRDKRLASLCRDLDIAYQP